MLPFRLPLAALLLALASGCTEPTPPCGVKDARELRVIEALITETRGNIERGYTVQRPQSNVGVNLCLGSHSRNVGVSFCTDPMNRTRNVATDTAAETRKLEALLARRDEINARLAATCPRP